MNIPVRWSLDNGVFDAYKTVGAQTSTLHGHSHFLLTLITGGEGIQTLNGQDIKFSAGDLFILSPVDFHMNKTENDKSYDYYGIKFNFDSLDPAFSELYNMDSFPIHVHLSPETAKKAVSVFEEILSEQLHNRPASELCRKILLEHLIILTMRELPDNAKNTGNTFYMHMLKFLYSHFHESINVSDGARYAGYTPNHFNTLFHKNFGMPFMEYLRKMRINYAKNLLLSGDISITQIAMDSGFPSLSHFSRCFRSECGISPRKFREENKNIHI